MFGLWEISTALWHAIMGTVPAPNTMASWAPRRCSQCTLEAMTELCREFGISRKTGYKIFDRYKEHGLEALTDRSRRPVRYANQLPGQVESLIVSLRRNKPHWGARKIRELLLRRLPGDIRLPAKSTIHAVLDRHGLVKRMGKRRSRATGTPLSKALAPNDLWCADC
jgi:transposase